MGCTWFEINQMSLVNLQHRNIKWGTSEAVWLRLLWWRPTPAGGISRWLFRYSACKSNISSVFLIKSRKIRNYLWVRCKRVKIHTKNSNLRTSLYQWADLLLLPFYPDHQIVKQLCLLFRLILLCAKGTHTLPGITAVRTPNKHTFMVLTHCCLFWPLMQHKPLNHFFSVSAIVLYITSYWFLTSYRCLTSHCCLATNSD